MTRVYYPVNIRGLTNEKLKYRVVLFSATIKLFPPDKLPNETEVVPS